MTVCNMSIEAGARAGLDRPRRHDLRLPRGPPPRRRRARHWEQALDDWRSLGTDDGAAFDKEVVDRRRRRCGPTSPGAPTRPGGRPSTASSPTPTPSPTPRQRESAERALAYMGLDRRHADRATSPSTPCSSARAPTAASRTCGPRPPSSTAGTVAVGMRALVVPGCHAGEGPGRGRGPRPGLPRRRVRLARAGLLDVPGHEPRQAGARRAVRRARRTATSRAARAGAGAPTSCRPRVAAATAVAGHFATPEDLAMEAVRSGQRARRCRSTAPTSTPTRSSRATGSSASSAPASARACSPSGATTATSCSTTSASRAPPSSWPGTTSAPARRGSTPSGPSWTTASRP